MTGLLGYLVVFAPVAQPSQIGLISVWQIMVITFFFATINAIFEASSDSNNFGSVFALLLFRFVLFRLLLSLYSFCFVLFTLL